MPENRFLTPAEIAEEVVVVAKKKAGLPAGRMLVLAIMAGIYIAFAAYGSTMGTHNLHMNPEATGLARAVTGVIFGTGLMLVVIAGAELFTGNNLMILGIIERKISWGSMFRNWGIVYLGNFIGSIFIVGMILSTGLLNASGGDLGGVTIRIAASKTNLDFLQAIILGVLCNMLVCGAVWMGYGAKDIASKILCCFFPIWLFVTAGFEHSIANMYYIPAGIIAAANPVWLEAAGLSGSAIANLTWANFLLKNLLPVTIGNIIGGTCIIGCLYWFSYLKKGKA